METLRNSIEDKINNYRKSLVEEYKTRSIVYIFFLVLPFAASFFICFYSCFVSYYMYGMNFLIILHAIALALLVYHWKEFISDLDADYSTIKKYANFITKSLTLERKEYKNSIFGTRNTNI